MLLCPRVSELRAVELLDDLCDAMNSYTLLPHNNTNNADVDMQWIKHKGQGAASLTEQQR